MDVIAIPADDVMILAVTPADDIMNLAAATADDVYEACRCCLCCSLL